MVKILLIDDDTDRLLPLVEELEFDRTHKVTVASNLNRAFEYLQAPDPQIDIIILDMIMAYGDKYTKGETTDGRETGYCLLRDLRSGAREFQVDRNIPVIVLTNIRKDESLKERTAKLGNVIFVEKPVTFDKIYESIDALLKSKPE